MRSYADSSARLGMFGAAGLAVILACMPLLARCGASASGASAVSYVTELDATRGLAIGSPTLVTPRVY